MGFGRNPYVSKAQDVELKAESAGDAASEIRIWLEAAHLWERAAAKEQPGKKRVQYEEAAQKARVNAENVEPPERGTAESVRHLRLIAESPPLRVA